MLGKTALRDTVLPVGGGPDGKSPVFVPKGANVSYNFHALHRRRSVYGDDAEDFNPDRWADPSFRPGWVRRRPLCVILLTEDALADDD